MANEDYALLAAKEFFTIERSKLVDDGDSDGLYELDHKEERLAAIIRRYAEQWAHDYSCGCM